MKGARTPPPAVRYLDSRRGLLGLANSKSWRSQCQPHGAVSNFPSLILAELRRPRMNSASTAKFQCRQSPLFAPRAGCLLYTSDAADDLLCVDLGGRRI